MRLVGDKWVMVLPGDAHELRLAVLSELHASALGGHMGRRKLEMQVRQRFYWPTLSADVRKFCQECDICQRSKVVT